MSTKKPHTFPFDKDDMEQAVKTLREGGVILYPTDTIWGIGCDATNADAVKRVYEIKRRQDSKAMIVLANSDAMIANHVEQAPEVAWDVVTLATNPTTVIFDKGRNLAPNLMAADGSVAFRLTREDFSSQLCFHLRKPIVSTSANISGQPSPKSFGDIADEIIKAVDYVVRYRQDDRTPASPSSIIKIGNKGEVKIIR
jgi:L-threonylcarbamoyladenylate synthase